jgi:hypothetical protein
MFSGLVGENRLFQPFVSNMFPGLGIFSTDGHNVTKKFAEKWRSVNSIITPARSLPASAMTI